MTETVYSYQTLTFTQRTVKQIKKRWYANVNGLWVSIWYGYVGFQLCWIEGE